MTFVSGMLSHTMEHYRYDVQGIHEQRLPNWCGKNSSTRSSTIILVWKATCRHTTFPRAVNLLLPCQTQRRYVFRYRDSGRGYFAIQALPSSLIRYRTTISQWILILVGYLHRYEIPLEYLSIHQSIRHILRFCIHPIHLSPFSHVHM